MVLPIVYWAICRTRNADCFDNKIIKDYMHGVFFHHRASLQMEGMKQQLIEMGKKKTSLVFHKMIARWSLTWINCEVDVICGLRAGLGRCPVMPTHVLA